MEGTRLVFFSNLSAEEHLRSSARYYATLQIRTYVIDMEDNIRGIYYQDSRRQVRREQLSKILTTAQLPMAEHIDKKSQMANASDRSLREDILRREGWEREYTVYSNSTHKDEGFEEIFKPRHRWQSPLTRSHRRQTIHF